MPDINVKTVYAVRLEHEEGTDVDSLWDCRQHAERRLEEAREESRRGASLPVFWDIDPMPVSRFTA